MKNLFFFLAFGSLFMLATQCANEGAGAASGKGAFTMKGQITDAAGMKIFFDKTSFSKNSSILGSTDIGADGKFNISLDEAPEAGIYRVRIGQTKGYFVFDGTEKKVELNGSLNDFKQSKQQVSGSKVTAEYLAAESKVRSGEVKGEAVANTVSALGAVPAAVLAFNLQKPDEAEAKAFDIALEKLKTENPQMATDFGNFVANRSAGPGAAPMAPDIRLNGPDGKEYALSDLRGKVVLLDFWASWCRPCRLENPNVVNVYDKYNKDGFEVFSVSLDDERRKGMEKWKEAIKKDDLRWPYHVSDLKGWSSAPAKLYGVRSIPKTFLIDKEGRIAGTNLRGPALEPAVKDLLAKK